MELFFDLVYVFAFTQLSELLYDNLGWLGAAEMAVIFVGALVVLELHGLGDRLDRSRTDRRSWRCSAC